MEGTVQRKGRAQMGLIQNVVLFIVIVIVGVYVAYDIIQQFASSFNLTGLWAVALEILEIVVPVGFIILAVYGLGLFNLGGSRRG